MDHILVDHIAVPPETAKWFTEPLGYLPVSFHLNSHRKQHPELQHLPSRQTTLTAASRWGVSGGTILACFNSLYKIDPDVFRVWLQLLDENEDTILWLFHWNEDSVASLKRVANATSRRVSRRIIFTEPLPEQVHKVVKGAASLFLDTPMYNAHGTAADALYVGTPVITAPGQILPRRIAASLLSSARATHLSVRNLDDYKDLVTALISRPGTLRRVRDSLLHHRHTAPVFDLERSVHALEVMYRLLWDVWVAGVGRPSVIVHSRNKF
mmetsp:Transcript_16998/g.40442  ORF Transcript_16998/g.40442 Transcript_16998/m.40442 type:complete len:268 (+) Transcript_16998:213-1016(+)